MKIKRENCRQVVVFIEFGVCIKLSAVAVFTIQSMQCFLTALSIMYLDKKLQRKKNFFRGEVLIVCITRLYNKEYNSNPNVINGVLDKLGVLVRCEGG